jgi:SpoVK/Ycf46/Vps4 family AAA+-type ATPase
MNLCDDTLDIDVVCNLVADSTVDKTGAQVVAACNEARLQCAKEIINRLEWLGSVGEDEPSLSLKHFSLALK